MNLSEIKEFLIPYFGKSKVLKVIAAARKLEDEIELLRHESYRIPKGNNKEMDLEAIAFFIYVLAMSNSDADAKAIIEDGDYLKTCNREFSQKLTKYASEGSGWGGEIYGNPNMVEYLYYLLKEDHSSIRRIIFKRASRHVVIEFSDGTQFDEFISKVMDRPMNHDDRVRLANDQYSLSDKSCVIEAKFFSFLKAELKDKKENKK